MSISTIKPSIDHAQLIIESQCSGNNLPFQEVLSAETIAEHLSAIECRHRIFTPTLTLYTFLSQVISFDQSCQAAVLSTLAKLASQGMRISAVTVHTFRRLVVAVTLALLKYLLIMKGR